MNVVVVKEREREGPMGGRALVGFLFMASPSLHFLCSFVLCKGRREGVFVTGTEERRVGASTLLRQGIADDGARAAAAAALLPFKCCRVGPREEGKKQTQRTTQKRVGRKGRLLCERHRLER